MIDIKEKTLDLVLKLQKESKNSDKYNYGTNNIKRLSKRSIAEIAEDMFAKYLYEVLEDEDIKIYINGNIKGMKPDIIVIKNNIIRAIIELKINFGWCRNIFNPKDKGKNKYKEASSVPDRIRDYNSLKGSIIKFAIQKNKDKIDLTLSNDCKIYYICTSKENYISGRDLIKDYEDFIDREKKIKEYLRFGIITDEYHDYKKNGEWPSKEQISSSIDSLFKTKYGMNEIIKEIKERIEE